MNGTGPLSAPSGSWDRRIWRLAGPIMLTNVTIPLLGAVDTAVVGHLPGPQYLGGVAVGALVFSVLYAGLNFLRMGTTGLTAQSFGARDMEAVRAWLGRALLLSAALGLVMVLLQLPIAWAAFTLTGASDEVSGLAESYFHIRIWGAPFALINFALLGWFFGVQDTRSALITQVYLNGANIVLDFLFVFGFGWGVDGVAWATLFSEVTAAGLGLWIASRKLGPFGGGWDIARLTESAPLKRMLGVNRDIFLRSMCLQGAFVAVTAYGARLGDETLAANAVLLQFQLFMAFGLDGFANAAEVLAGESVGAKNRKTFRAAFLATGRWALIFAVGFTVIFFALGPVIIDLLTDVQEVRMLAYAFLPWTAVSPLVSVWCFQLDGVFIGSTRTAAMRNGMAASLVLFLALLPFTVPAFGNHGLWGTFLIFMAARGVTLGVIYPRLERSLEQA